MTIQTNFPAIKPTLLLDFANTEQLDPRITFTRASTGTYFDALGIMQTAASGVARFEHNPVTGESLGLEIEEQRTNLVTYSEQFDNAAWAKVGSSISANATVALDGNLTADKIVEDTANSTHQISQDFAVTSGTSYTFTVFAKAAERTAFALRMNAGGYGALVTASFNLSAQTATVVTAGTSTSASITAVGNGWFRCSLTSQATATTSTSHFVFVENPAGTRTYTGNGTSGIFIWGAQLEAGAFPTSYIPTVASQVTRAADAASMTGTNFSSWYNQAEGSFYLQGSTYDAETPTSQVFLNVGTSSEGHQIFAQLTDGILTGLSNVASVVQAQLALANLADGPQSFTAAYAYKVNDYAGVANGGTVLTDISGTVPTTSITYIGNRADGIRPLNGTIRKIAYYPLRVSNNNLQALTS